jgi:hypothetical protein
VPTAVIKKIGEQARQGETIATAPRKGHSPVHRLPGQLLSNFLKIDAFDVFCRILACEIAAVLRGVMWELPYPGKLDCPQGDYRIVKGSD